MNSPPRIFDRQLLRLRRASQPRPRNEEVTFLRDEIEARLVDRLDDIKREFGRVLVLGTPGETLERRLAGIKDVVVLDDVMPDAPGGARVVADEELLPFAPGRFDAVLVVGKLHWVNDLPGVLAQINACLVPDGMLLAGFPGEETLKELRGALMAAELELRGGAAPRVSPFVDVRDAGMLLQRAGFALPVADRERLTVRYAQPLRLLGDLRAMGESNALAAREGGILRRDVLMRALQIYVERHGDAEGRVPASFELVFITGWKPHESQPQPLRRGSGQVNLAKALGVPLSVLEGRGDAPDDD